MLTSVAGVYRGGRVELAETPADVHDDTQVIVTFLPAGVIDLRARGVGETEAAELRARLAAFAEDWDSPEMDIYDDYDAALLARSRAAAGAKAPDCGRQAS